MENNTQPNKSKKLIPNCRYYGLFAISKTEPNLILGYVENSFSMGWSRHCVNIWPAYRKNELLKMAKREVKDVDLWDDKKFIDFCESHYNVKYGKEDAFYTDGMPIDEARQGYLNMWYAIKEKSYGHQNAWNELSERGIYVPKGFYTKVFRLDSKKLPVIVDLRYRVAIERHKKVTWDKWYYRNAHFWVKALNPDKTIENSGGLPFNIPKEQYNGKCVYEYGITCSHKSRNAKEHPDAHVLSRSEYKKLKHQKDCKSIAEKGSPEVVGAFP